MRLAWAGCLLLGAHLFAGTQDSENNVNTRYTVETVVVAADGWTADLAADHSGDERISAGLRRQMASLIGDKLNPGRLDDVASKLRREFHARTVIHHVVRGATPEYVRVLFEVKMRPAHFDVSVPRFVYSSGGGWSGAVDASASVGHQNFAFGLLSDGDTMVERFTGVEAQYQDSHLGSDHLRFDLRFASYHELWNPATRNDLTSTSDTSGLYRARQMFQPEMTFVVAKPLTISVGASFQKLDGAAVPGQTENADAATATVRYHRLWDDSDYRQDLDADYDLHAATRVLASDFVYLRNHWTVRYVITHGKNTLADYFTIGMLAGRAPLFERYVLGNSTTLRGWNRYEIDPLGGNRMVHNSVEYRYGWFQAFYDAGAIWDAGQPAPVRHSLGMGVHPGPLFVAVAFPVRRGTVDPVFMVGMNY